MQYIAIEGMPGAGKTSMLSRLIYDLPVEYLWLPELNIEPSLSEQYSEMEKWKVYCKLWEERLTILQSASSLNFISDRSPYTNLAYSYAVQDQYGYSKQLSLIEAKFKDNFTAMLVLSVSPEIGLQRRQYSQGMPPWPWSCKDFLSRLQEFYHTQLPQIHTNNLHYINTDTLSIIEAYDAVKSVNWMAKITQDTKRNYFTHSNAKSLKDLIDAFAHTHKLGDAYTPLLDVLGYASVYFRQHVVQVNENGEPEFLNNARLKKILSQCHTRFH